MGDRAQSHQRGLQMLAVLADQRPLHPPHFRTAEKVERGAAQELQLREHSEYRQYPGAE